jgi:hypothetical protein
MAVIKKLLVYMYRDTDYNHRTAYSIQVRVGILFGTDRQDQDPEKVC